MTAIPFRAGLNNDRLEFFPHPDFVVCYRGVLMAVGLDLCHRFLYLSAAEHGNRLRTISGCRHESDPPMEGYSFMDIDDRGLAEFNRHDVELEEYEPNKLRWAIPYNHLLPWLEGRKVSPKNRRGSALRGLRLRVRSAVEHGYDLKQLVADTPRWVKSELTAAEWRETVIDRATLRRAA